MPKRSVPARGVVLTPRGILVARRRPIATGSSKYDMSGILPSRFRNMTICSSINTLRISTVNSDYDFICAADQSRGIQMKCIDQVVQAVFLMLICSTGLWGQTPETRPAETSSQPFDSVPLPAPVSSIPLTVPPGTPLKVALDSEVRVREVGQAIHGKTTEPMYAFDQLLIPAGTVVNGKISAIDGVPAKIWVMDATDGNFSPARHVHVQFNELVMSDGRHVALQTVASPAPDGVLRFVSANEKAEPKNKVQDAASKKMSATRRAIQQQWSDLQKQIHEPGKMHKMKRMALAQLPVHPQYIDAGTSFHADLLQPLDFGTEAEKPGALTDIGAPPPNGKRGACAAGDAAELVDGKEGRLGRGADHRAAGGVGSPDSTGGQCD